MIRNVIIIGAGPSGYTAAIYLSRAGLKPLLLAGEKAGGQLMWTSEVDNYPGFSDGVLGPDLMEQMRKQAEKFGTEILNKNVTRVDLKGEVKKIWVGETEYVAKAVIVSSGARARMLEIGEEKLLGRGVSTCAMCDAAFFKDKTTYVVGGGDAAMEEVMALKRQAKKVGLIYRGESLRASKAMQEKVLEGVEIMWNSEVIEIIGEQKLEKIKIKNNKTGEEKELLADGLFLAIGHLPETSLFKGQLELDEKGYLKVKGFSSLTSVEGVFGAGDVVDFRYRQAITAAGMGCMAALDAEKFLTGVVSEY